MNPLRALARQRSHARARAVLAAHAWPEVALDVLDRLRAGGGRAWFVGGVVRDVLLGRVSDGPIDLATDRLPDQVIALFPRVEPIGIEHGTVLVLHRGLPFEVTTLRREGEYADARHPDEVWFTTDPLEDLDRRDLTVNALAYDPRGGELLDPHDGAGDLERRVLRAVGDPLARFREDALRPLRVARFAAQLEMEPERETRRALREVSGRMPLLAPERVRAELEKMLAAPRPSRGLQLMSEAELLEPWLHELAVCRGVPQNRHHAHDVWFHSLYSCDAAPASKPLVRWAALLHDVGKPATRAERNGEGTFYNHEVVGAAAAADLLERLRFPAAFVAGVVHLVRQHMFDYRTNWSDAAVRRWLARVGPGHLADLFDLRIADSMGNGRKAPFPPYLDELAARVERIMAEGAALRVGDLAVDGRDVMEVLGVPPGPPVGQALDALLEDVLDDPARNTREALRARLALQARDARPQASNDAPDA